MTKKMKEVCVFFLKKKKKNKNPSNKVKVGLQKKLKKLRLVDI